MSSYLVEILNDVQAISAGINPAIYIGQTGATPELTIGTVEFGDVSSATITGTPEHPVLNLVLERGKQGIQGEKGDTVVGPIGPQGLTGVGIASFARTSGTGAPGSIDVYTLTMTDGSTATISVYNGKDGEGSGNMHTDTYDQDGDGVVDRAKVADTLNPLTVIGINRVDGLEEALENKAPNTPATPAAPGLMSAADKAKLDTVAQGANNYTHPTTDGNKHVPATGTDNDGKVLMAGETAGSFSWKKLTASDVGAAKAPTFANIVIPSGAWTGTGPYFATATVAGVPADGNGVKLGLSASATDAEYEAAAGAQIWPTTTGWALNTIALVARGDKPEVDLPVSVEIGG